MKCYFTLSIIVGLIGLALTFAAPPNGESAYVVAIYQDFPENSISQTSQPLLITVVDSKRIADMLKKEDSQKDLLKTPSDPSRPALVDQFVRLIQPGNPFKLVVDSVWKFGDSEKAEKATKNILKQLVPVTLDEFDNGWIRITPDEFRKFKDQMTKASLMK